MNLNIQNTYKFSQNIVPNTFIGGVAGTINTPKLLADRMQINRNRIRGFKVFGLDLQCRIIGNYTFISAYISAVFPTTLTRFVDNDQLLTGFGNGHFVGMVNLVQFEAYGINTFGSGGFPKFTNTKVEELYFPNLTTGTTFSNLDFGGNSELKRFLVPNNITTGGENFISGSPKMELIDMRKMKQVGRTSPSRGNVFSNVGSALIPGIGKFHQNIVSVSADGGNPDVNMMKLYNKGWQIQLYNDAGVYVGDFTI